MPETTSDIQLAGNLVWRIPGVFIDISGASRVLAGRLSPSELLSYSSLDGLFSKATGHLTRWFRLQDWVDNDALIKEGQGTVITSLLPQSTSESSYRPAKVPEK